MFPRFRQDSSRYVTIKWARSQGWIFMKWITVLHGGRRRAFLWDTLVKRAVWVTAGQYVVAWSLPSSRCSGPGWLRTPMCGRQYLSSQHVSVSDETVNIQWSPHCRLNGPHTTGSVSVKWATASVAREAWKTWLALGSQRNELLSYMHKVSSSFA